jgi:thiamine-phosphate pyrophosphorylase
MLLYYVTDRTQLGEDESSRRTKLLEKIAEAAQAGIDYIQLREKDLSARELERLAREARARISRDSQTRLLINSRIDVALAAGADGVHLRSDDINAAEARAVFAKSQKPSSASCMIGVSCHSAEEVALAEAHGAEFAVFGPVFEKSGAAKNRLDELRRACERPVAAAKRMPVLALGGISAANAAECLHAGAGGIAGIRIFQQHDIASVTKALRVLAPSKLNSRRRHPYFEK